MWVTTKNSGAIVLCILLGYFLADPKSAYFSFQNKVHNTDHYSKGSRYGFSKNMSSNESPQKFGLIPDFSTYKILKLKKTKNAKRMLCIFCEPLAGIEPATY
jgi:hypothetical protein